MAGCSKASGAKWDPNTQTFHGGQDWSTLSNFKEDFSVTTNGLGTPELALAAATKAMTTIHHYPPADFQPALSHLTDFLWPETQLESMPLVLLGNGASELIDLVIRSVPAGGWRPGGTLTQYKEYERSSGANNRPTCAYDDPTAVLTCMVNPTNPTGDYLTIEAMKEYLTTQCPDNHTVIVDESMQPWVGPEWRHDSLIHQREWIATQAATRNLHVWVMTSWTKIWSCTGLRLGSVIAPTAALAQRIKRTQIPWSVNSMALVFLSQVVQDTMYLQQTWEVTPVWRRYAVSLLASQFPTWKVYGAPFLSWIWIDTTSEASSVQACSLAKASGVPLRSGAPGYELPTYIRMAVRNQAMTDVLMHALLPLQH